MTTNRTNRRAEEFDAALSADSRATMDPGMKALVAVAGALAAIPQQPAPAFRDALRTRLMAEAAQLAATAASVPAATAPAIPAQVTPLKSLPKLLAKPAMQVATGGLAVTVAATGIGVGASRSLPGDTLYGLKRTVERLQEDTAGGTLAETDAVLEHAHTRVNELAALLERDGTAAVADVERTLNDLKAELDKATAELLAQVRAGSAAAYAQLDAAVSTLTNELEALRGDLPPGARDEFAALLGALNGVHGQLKALAKPGTGGLPTDPTKPPVTPTTPPTSTKPPATTPPTGGIPTVPTVPPPPTKPGSSTSPSTPTLPTPTIGVPTTTPTLPTLPPVPPSLPVTLPPVLP